MQQPARSPTNSDRGFTYKTIGFSSDTSGQVKVGDKTPSSSRRTETEFELARVLMCLVLSDHSQPKQKNTVRQYNKHLTLNKESTLFSVCFFFVFVWFLFLFCFGFFCFNRQLLS